MSRTTRFVVAIVCLAFSSGCDEPSEEEETQAELDVVSEVVVPEIEDVTAPPEICERPLGAGCLEDAHCSEGFCFISEFAPFGICTVACKNPGDYCTGLDDKQYDGFWCVEPPPEEFKKFNHQDTTAFCMKICQDKDECLDLEPGYESCEQVSYKGTALYAGSPMDVCQAQSAVGKVPVDPFTCENWKATNPGNPNEKLKCANYCSYLNACQYYEAGASLECCEWYCYNRLVKVGFIDGEYEDILRQFNEYFTAFAGTGQQCEAKTKFGDPPIPDANKPTPDGFLCE